MAENENEFLESCNMESRGFTTDGSVDLKGRPVLKSKTGGWKACSFFVCYEILERMAFYGIVSNLVIYLTTKLHEGTVKSAANVSNWSGTVWVTPIVGAYIADTHWGRYWTFTVFSCIYILRHEIFEGCAEDPLNDSSDIVETCLTKYFDQDEGRKHLQRFIVLRGRMATRIHFRFWY